MMSDISREAARRLRVNRPFHIPPPAHPLNATVQLMLEGVDSQPTIILRDVRQDYKWKVVMTADAAQANTWHAEITLPMEMTIVEYFFRVNGYEIDEYRQVEGENYPVYGTWEEKPFKIAVYDPDRMPADWVQGMVVYQIFPDRFAKVQSDADAKAAMRGVYGHEPLFLQWGDIPEAPPLGRDFFGGDLRGIIEKLDYIQSMGVDCIYLNPIFEASANHRYEAIDFMNIDPMLGTQEDFDALIEEAHKRDIKIVLDAVFNHCSSDSIYFDITNKYGNGAYHSQESPYYRWFKFQEWPDTYDGWYGLGFMPEFVECPEMQAYFLGQDGVTQHWLKRGIDGWRADVPFDNTDVFWKRWRTAIDEINPEVWTIAEEWRDATHYMLGDQFNATMNYRFTWAVRGFLATDDLTPTELDDRLQIWMRDTPAPARHAQMNLVDSHDTNRILTACNGNHAKHLQVAAFQFAYPGAPTLFYGGETGLMGENSEDSRRCMPWDNLDEDMVAYFRHLMNYRQQSEILRRGDTETVLIDDEKRAYGYARRLNGESIYAVFNASDTPIVVTVPLQSGEDGLWSDIIDTHPDVTALNGQLTVELQPRGAAWYKKSQ